MEGRRTPTEKMLNYAKFIEFWSDVPMDEAVEHDFWSCHGYISANEGEARRKYRAANPPPVLSLRRYSRRTTEYVGGDYGVCGNDWGVDCYDMGIAPWGDS